MNLIYNPRSRLACPIILDPKFDNAYNKRLVCSLSLQLVLHRKNIKREI